MASKRQPGVLGLNDYSGQICSSTLPKDFYGSCRILEPTNTQCVGVVGFYPVKEEKWSIKQIPKIMRANGLNKGAALMDHWFSRPSYTYPDEFKTNTGLLPYNDEIITIEWANKFSSVKDAYNEAWSGKQYATSKVKDYIKVVLEEKGAFSKKKTPFKFGDLSLSVNDINSGDFYVKNIIVETSSVFDDLNDMVAALANFNFRFAIEGKVTFNKTQETYYGLGENEDVYTIKIEKVGLYIRDSYDFIGSQFPGLGCWNMKTNEITTTCFFGGDDFHKVENATFREWRDKNSMGGDFLVFSDLEVRTVNESWDVEIKIG